MGYAMSGFIEGTCRTQATLFPDRLDDYITEENAIRVIDAFIDNLDLANLGFKTVSADTGRPAYHPSTMLKLFVYGYLNRVQSSRRLEREAGRNVELMWLLGRLAPDFKTIADFRKDNGKGIKNTCRAFIDICRQLKLFTDVVVAIDGSKFKAVNSKENNYTPKKLQFHIARVEKHIDDYLKQLDDSDREEEKIIDETPIKEKIAWLVPLHHILLSSPSNLWLSSWLTTRWQSIYLLVANPTYDMYDRRMYKGYTGYTCD